MSGLLAAGNLLRLLGVRQARLRPGRAVLTMLSVVIGVGGVVAVTTATNATHEAYTDMFAAMRAYYELNWTGPMRPDHVPTFAGEANENPGYEVLGRLYALGYIKGLMEGVRATIGD